MSFCYACGRPAAGTLCESCLESLPRHSREGGCSVCGRPLWGLEGRCWSCRDLSVVLDSIHAPFQYEGTAKLLFQRYKFHRGWGLTRLWVESLLPFVEPGWVLVPIPPKLRNLRRRGWDPVGHLWERLRARGCPGRRLFLPQDGLEQKTLGRNDRAREDGALRLVDQATPPFVLLLDDTVTTGATLNRHAKALLERGARSVRGLALTLAP